MSINDDHLQRLVGEGFKAISEYQRVTVDARQKMQSAVDAVLAQVDQPSSTTITVGAGGGGGTQALNRELKEKLRGASSPGSSCSRCGSIDPGAA